jgi:hypothetical protein
LARSKRGVERRVIPLPLEYSKPLAKLDRKYHGTPVGQVGPLERRLQGYDRLQCLVMGSFQEGSKDLHALLETLADCRLRARGLARGREVSKCAPTCVPDNFAMFAKLQLHPASASAAHSFEQQLTCKTHLSHKL